MAHQNNFLLSLQHAIEKIHATIDQCDGITDIFEIKLSFWLVSVVAEGLSYTIQSTCVSKDTRRPRIPSSILSL